MFMLQTPNYVAIETGTSMVEQRIHVGSGKVIYWLVWLL